MDKKERDEEIRLVEYKSGKPGFIPVYYDLVDVDGDWICGEEKFIYIVLLRFFNDNKKYAYPSLTKLSALTGWGRNKVIKYIKSLETKGLIKKDTNLFRTEQNNQYTLYDIELVSKTKITKKEFYYQHIIGQLNKHFEKDINTGYYPAAYSQLKTFFEEIRQKEKVFIGKKEVSVTNYFEKLTKATIDQLITVAFRVIEKDALGEVKHKLNYLIKSLYEASFSESVG